MEKSLKNLFCQMDIQMDFIASLVGDSLNRQFAASMAKVIARVAQPHARRPTRARAEPPDTSGPYGAAGARARVRFGRR